MGGVWTLTLDTATPYLSLGLFRGEEGLGRVVRVERRHEEVLFGLLDETLEALGVRREEIGALVLGEGPGSYTGLRIALAAGAGRRPGLGGQGLRCELPPGRRLALFGGGEAPHPPLHRPKPALLRGHLREGRREAQNPHPPHPDAGGGASPPPHLLDAPPDPRALYELLPFAREGVEPLYL
jgi:hypothetical protein